MKTCRIRRDIIENGERVKIERAFIGTNKEYIYRWTGRGGSVFQVWYKGNWNTADSIDFEFD